MIPGAKLGPFTVLMVYLVASMGLMTGAHVGYHADSADNATMQYNADTSELRIGNETIDIYDENEDSNATIGLGDADGNNEPGNHSDLLSDRGESIFNGSDEHADELDAQLEAATPETIDDVGMAMGNATVDFAMQTMADVGGVTAGIAYKYQDTVRWQTVWVVTTALVFGPLLAALYFMLRRVVR